MITLLLCARNSPMFLYVAALSESESKESTFSPEGVIRSNGVMVTMSIRIVSLTDWQSAVDAVHSNSRRICTILFRISYTMSFPPKHVKIRFGRSSDLFRSLAVFPFRRTVTKRVAKELCGTYSCGNSPGLSPDSLFTFVLINTPTPILGRKSNKFGVFLG